VGSTSFGKIIQVKNKTALKHYIVYALCVENSKNRVFLLQKKSFLVGEYLFAPKSSTTIILDTLSTNPKTAQQIFCIISQTKK